MSLEEERQKRDAALDLLERARAEYLAGARKAAVEVALAIGTITVNDVRKVYPPPECIDGRVMGAIFRNKLWQPVGTIPSDRAHARPIMQFRLEPLLL